MKVFKKILLAIVDITTFVIGTGVFVTNALDNYEENAGIGAAMIVFGFLVRSWREKSEDRKNRNTKPFVNKLSIGLLLIAAFSFWAKNHNQISYNSRGIDDLENEVNSKVDESEYYYEIEKLKSNSHYHGY